ncbi:MAG: DNA gyrase subunit A [Clostridia bacterium]|nr:DNA gyrase subunit A [Clostridia bacterium]
MDELQGLGMPQEKIIDVDLEKEVKKSFLDYSMSVIVSRALPDVRDGLKPVHRRILYTMYENSLWPERAYRKCADTVGSVLGRYHPHGDASVYDALVRLAQDFSMRYPLVDGHGNFGSVDGDPPAAYRYTESRLCKLSVDLLEDIDKETVDFIPNYDDRLKEPTVLPCHIPNLLINGSTGIAVGMATNIPPHNMGEVIDGMCCLIDNPDATLDDIMEYVKGPDFPTGGIIMGRSGIRAAYATGRGKITLRAKTEIEEGKDGRAKIIVTEIPYQVNKARLIESIADLVKEKRIDGIANVEDHSDRDGMYIVIDTKRDARPSVVLNQLFSYSQMQITYGVIMLAIVGGEPKTLSLIDYLKEYIRFQEEVVRRRTQFDLRKAKERMHILEGLKIAVDAIDEIVRIIRTSKDRPEARARMTERFGLDDIQTQAIVQMPLGSLTGLERQRLEDEIASLSAKIEDYLDILENEWRVLAIIKDEALEMKRKYSDERRTEITAIDGEVDIEDLIPREDCVLILTNSGYVKRQSVDTYKQQKRGGRGINGMKRTEEDAPAQMFIANSHDFILFFTSFGKVYKLKCYEIPASSRNSIGRYITNFLPLLPGEKISSMLRLSEFEEDKYLVMVTKHGIIKRTAMNAYNSSRKGGIIAIVLDEGDELRWVQITGGSDDLLVATRRGMAIRFNEEKLREMGRVTRGVKAITLRENDEIVGLADVDQCPYVLTVSETGYGRISPVSDYRLQNRGGKGLINYHIEKYGEVAAMRAIGLDEDIILISKDGVVIRIPADSVRICARPSKGVKVMRIDGEENKVVSIACVPQESDEETDALPDDPDASLDEEDDLEEITETPDEPSQECSCTVRKQATENKR